MYSAATWNHIRDPRNRGELPDASCQGESHFSKCGDFLTLQLRVEHNQITAARFTARACAPVAAAASVGTELLIGQSVEQALQTSALTLDAALGGLPGPKRHALWMFLECLHEALKSKKEFYNDQS